jgi:hypothetical protein
MLNTVMTRILSGRRFDGLASLLCLREAFPLLPVLAILLVLGGLLVECRAAGLIPFDGLAATFALVRLAPSGSRMTGRYH